MRKKLFKLAAVAMAAVMQLGFAGVFAAGAASQPREMLATVVNNKKCGDYYLDDYVLLESGKKIDASAPIKASARGGSSPSPDAAYPPSYDLREYDEVTSTKDQGSCGSCWAFGAMGAMESSLIKSGAVTKAQADYSEAHLVWFSQRSLVTDEADGTAGDGISVASPYDAGGNWNMVTSAVTRGAGLEYESSKPFYPLASDRNKMGNYPESERYISNATITDAAVLETDNEVKSALMSTGAAMVSLWYDSAYLSGNNAYYSGGNDYRSNHVVLIVGWDDNYSVSNFASGVRPVANGAWLCRNSFGSDFGDGGYFWVSFREPSLDRAVAFKTALTKENEKIYQYDGYGWQAYLSTEGATVKTGTVANIFTASRNETLNSVAFYTDNPDDVVTYTVSVFSGVGSSPDSGTLLTKATTTGAVTNTGYHRVNLASPVDIAAGTRFSVVVKLSIPSSSPNEVCLVFEGGGSTGNANPDNDVHFAAKQGCSFYKFVRDTWTDSTDISGRSFNNVCVKAFTTRQTSLRVAKDPDKMEYFVGESLSTSGMELTLDNGGAEPVSASSCTYSPATFTVADNATMVTVFATVGGETYSAALYVIVKPTALSFTGQKDINIKPGATAFVPLSVTPEGGEVSFTANPNSCFEYTVAEGGVNITGTRVGVGTLSATLMIGKPALRKTDSVTINVSDTVPVQAVRLSATNLVMKYGTTHTLVAEVSPLSATNKSVTWESSNPSVATVDANGVLTPRNAGSTVISATCADGNLSANCTVTVTMTFFQRLIRWFLSLFGGINAAMANIR